MSSRTAEDLLADTRTNALIGWGIVLFLGITAGERFLRGDLAWGVFVTSVLVLCLVPPVTFRDAAAMMPWEIITLAALPTFGGAVATFELTSDLSLSLSVAALALIVAVELDLFTPVGLTVGFAILFVVLATLATAGLWALCRWGLDLVLGTEFLLKPGVDEQVIHDELMIEFFYAALAGVLAGGIFEFYFRRYATPEKRVPEAVLER